MKILFWILTIITTAVVGLGLFAPKEMIVEKTIVINRSQNDVFNYLQFLKNSDAWSPWAKKDPNMKKTFSGTDGTVGFIMGWSGNNAVGVGEQEIKKIEKGTLIETELRFQKPMQNTNKAFLKIEAKGEQQTQVTWTMTGTTKFPANIIVFLLNARGQLGKDFTQGLENLKSLLEQPQPQNP